MQRFSRAIICVRYIGPLVHVRLGGVQGLDLSGSAFIVRVGLRGLSKCGEGQTNR